MQEAKVVKTDSAEEFFRALGDDDFFLLGEGEFLFLPNQLHILNFDTQLL